MSWKEKIVLQTKHAHGLDNCKAFKVVSIGNYNVYNVPRVIKTSNRKMRRVERQHLKLSNKSKTVHEKKRTN